jgi:hypothetical protein
MVSPSAVVLVCLSLATRVCADLTQAEKDEVLKIHNDFRRAVAQGNVLDVNSVAQPKASNMREMVWSDELAAGAQEWAERCRFEHSSGDYGENLAWSSSESAQPPLLANLWPNEITKTEIKGSVSNFEKDWISQNPQIGHYTQVVWADSYELGCGSQVCPGDGTYMVCRYNPSGNWIGEPVYKEGEACSACPSGSQCNDGLCKA